MAALTADTPQTYGSTGFDMIDRFEADEEIFEGCALVEGVAVGTVQIHGTETGGVICFAR